MAIITAESFTTSKHTCWETVLVETQNTKLKKLSISKQLLNVFLQCVPQILRMFSLQSESKHWMTDCFRAMLLLSPSAAQGKTLEAPVHQSSPQNASPAASPRQNLSQIGGTHLSPHQSTGSGIFCRICHEGDFLEPLLSPCNCSGSVGFYSSANCCHPCQVGWGRPSQLPGKMAVLLSVRYMWALQVEAREVQLQSDQLKPPGNHWRWHGGTDQYCNGFVKEKVEGTTRGTWCEFAVEM